MPVYQTTALNTMNNWTFIHEGTRQLLLTSPFRFHARARIWKPTGTCFQSNVFYISHCRWRGLLLHLITRNETHTLDYGVGVLVEKNNFCEHYVEHYVAWAVFNTAESFLTGSQSTFQGIYHLLRKLDVPGHSDNISHVCWIHSVPSHPACMLHFRIILPAVRLCPLSYMFL